MSGWGNDSTGDDGWGNNKTEPKSNDTGGGWGSDSKADGCDGGWGTDTGNSTRGGGWGNDSGGGSFRCGRGGGGGGGGGGRSCYNCGESGHMSRECPAPKKQGGGCGGGGGSCYNCGESGHMSRDCPAPRKQGSGGGSCYNCGESGHMSRDCSAPRKQGAARGGRGSGWGSESKTDSGGGWGNDNGNSSKSGGGGWGNDTGSASRSGGGWWGNDTSNSSKSGCGGWGNDTGSASRSGGGGWGNDTGSASRSGGGWWGNDTSNSSKSGGGGWGNDTGNFSKSGGGGWGNDTKDESKASGGSGGGWGSSNDNAGNSNGWGNDASSGPKKTSWDDNGDGQDRKRPRRDGQDSNLEADVERRAPYKPDDLNIDEEVKLQGEGAGENFKRYQEQKVTCLPVDAVLPIEKFDEIISSDVLMSNIKSQKYSEMTPIQKWAIPAIMDGHDIISCAQTGSGKTAAFILPILQTILKMDQEPIDLNSDCQNPYCLILSPTRELANQIYVHANMLAKDSMIKCHVIYGQISTAHLKSKLSTGCHVLVATPGRLKDFVQRGWIGFKNIKYIVLDEGDRLVDEGFTTDIRSFFNHESMPPREKRQTLFFSATFKASTQLNAKEYLKDNFIFLSVGRVGAANEDIRQEFLVVSRTEKKRELKKILESLPENEKTIIFTQTKQAADILAGFFTTLNLAATSIHGDRHQSQREQAIKAFRRGEKRFLISSPVGNRGLDLPQVALVINYDLPTDIDEYVHRIGRTGRAGHTGRAISFFDETRDSELIPNLKEILTEAKQEIPDWMSGSTEKAFGDDNFAVPQGDDDWALPNGGSVEVTATTSSTAYDEEAW